MGSLGRAPPCCCRPAGGWEGRPHRSTGPASLGSWLWEWGFPAPGAGTGALTGDICRHVEGVLASRPQGPGGGWAPGAVASPAGPPSEAASPASCRSGGIACAPPVALRGETAQALPLPGLRPHVEGALLPSEAAVALLGRRGDVGPGARLPHFWAPVALGFARGAAGSLARAGGSAGTAKAHVGFPEPVPQAGGRGCPGPPGGLSLPDCQGGAAPASIQVTPRWPWLW